MVKKIWMYLSLSLLCFVLLTNDTVWAKKHGVSSESGAYLATFYANKNADFEKAYQYLSRLVKANPKSIHYQEKFITYSLITGRYKEAEKYARAVYKKDKTKTLPQLLLSFDQVKKKNWKKALAYLDDLPKDFKEHFFVNLIRAWILIAKEDYQPALEIMQKNKDKLPRLYFTNLAMMLDYAGEKEQALFIYKKIVNEESSANFYYIELIGDLLYRTKGAEEGKKFFKGFENHPIFGSYVYPLLKRNDDEKPTTSVTESIPLAIAHGLSLMGITLHYAGDLASGLTFMQMAAFIEPNFDYTYVNMMVAYADKGRYTEAVKAAEKIKKDSPYYWDAALQRADALVKMKKKKEALALLDRLANERKSDTRALVAKGDVYRQDKDYKKAKEIYSQAITRDKKLSDKHNWTLYYARGICLERLGEWEEAEEDFLYALELKPDQALVLNYLGYSWIEQGKNLERAQEMVRKAVDLRPKDGFITDSLGWVLYKLGKYEEAVKYLELATTLELHDPTIHDHLGDAYWQVGRKIEARFEWEKVLKMNPSEELEKTVREKLIYGIKSD